VVRAGRWVELASAELFPGVAKRRVCRAGADECMPDASRAILDREIDTTSKAVVDLVVADGEKLQEGRKDDVKRRVERCCRKSGSNGSDRLIYAIT